MHVSSGRASKLRVWNRQSNNIPAELTGLRSSLPYVPLGCPAAPPVGAYAKMTRNLP